jgi:hypothetical protein
VYFSEQARAGSWAGGKRPHSLDPSDHEEQGPRLSLVTSLPLSVWREHLMPLLSYKAAARLRRSCKALKDLVTEWPVGLGEISPENLKAALTCFPATKALNLSAETPLEAAEESRMVELLRGHGGTLKTVISLGEGAERVLSSAVLAGALPKLTYSFINFRDPIHLQILSGGMLGLLEDVTLLVMRADHLAPLEHLRHLRHLRCLRLTCDEPEEAAFPPFIPPSLKILHLDVNPLATLEALLRELPPMLQASGARLEEIMIERTVDVDFEEEPEPLTADCGAALAQVLQACSSTLKIVKLVESDHVFGNDCIPGLLPGVLGCCDTLEVLHCPFTVFSALPATCPSFPRLTELELDGGDQNIESPARVWDIMASGRLPALASLCIHVSREIVSNCLEGEGVSVGGCRLARALEGVAGTLKQLILTTEQPANLPVGACYDLGAAIGKLRRLKRLVLVLCGDGQDFHAIGRGLAASGGCPELVTVSVNIDGRHVEWLTYEPSVIVPSVRDLRIGGKCTEEEELLLCCSLVQSGYRFSFESTVEGPADSPLDPSVAACMLTLTCEDAHEAAFPPFIPPSLKILVLEVSPAVHLESLLRELPSMLRAGGARLKEIELSATDELSVESGAALAQVLRECCPRSRS